MEEVSTIRDVILTADGKTMGDSVAKVLLKDKLVAKKILQEALNAAGIKVESLNEISIEDEILSDQPLFRKDYVKGISNEDRVLAEKDINFDILFEATIAETSEHVKFGVVVDVEMQGIANPTDYDLAARMTYYLARQTSRQLATRGDNNYDSLQRVFSVWICLPPNRKSQNHVAVVKREVTMVEGELETFLFKTFDLETLVIVVLGNAEDEVKSDLLRFANALFGLGADGPQRVNRLHEIGFPMEKGGPTEGAVMNVSNFMDCLGKREREEGRIEGIEIGEARGIEIGEARGEAQKEASLSANFAAIVEALRQNVPFTEIQQKFGITDPALLNAVAKTIL